MATFDDLIKKEEVANHPLLKGYKNLSESRRVLQAQEQDLRQRIDNLTKEDLRDIFSEKNNVTGNAMNFRGMVFEASKILNDTLCQFILPIQPKVSYNNTRDIKYARNSETEIVEGLVLFNVGLVSKSGVRQEALVPVKVQGGIAVPPSVMQVAGRLYTVSQDSFDSILERVTSYEVPELRTQYEAPLTKEERAYASEIRDIEGPRVRDNTPNYLNKKRDAAVNVPRGFKQALDEMQQAEEEGFDTFPRPWVYLLRNYILNHVSTAARDQWEPHLINKGYALNPWGVNRGRKRGQALDFDEDLEMGEEASMEKEIDMEVSGEPMAMEEVLEEVIELLYPGTKTPIESGDGVNFSSPKGKMRGNIVEVDPETDTLIVKSKGMEYRVKVEDITPLPSTFKKMYI